jgi:hypothetical protein
MRNVSITKVGKTYVCYQSIDPDRAEAINALIEGMNAFPDLRIGQLINNARCTCQITKLYDDEFHITDKRFGQMITDFVERMKEVSNAEKEDENE